MRVESRTVGRSEGQLSLLPLALSPPLPVLDRRDRGTTFHAVPVRTVLNPPSSTGMDFWTLNPYVGCEFGCCYCYARDTHRWVMERSEGRKVGKSERAGGRRQRSATRRRIRFILLTSR